MEDLTNAELFELFFIAQEFVEAQFQYWMSISFAAVVGVFVAASRLNRSMRYAIVALYLLASSLFLMRYLAALGELGLIAQVAESRALLSSQGDVLTIPIVTVRMALFSLGIVTTVWFLVRGGRNQES